MDTATVKLEDRDPFEGAHTYRVEVDGAPIGRVTAPARGLGERYWVARLDGVARSVTTTADTRREAVAALVAAEARR